MSDYPTMAVRDGVGLAAARQGLKTVQALTDAVKSDPLAFQVGADLGTKLVGDRSGISLSEVKACESDKACTAGMVVGVQSNDASAALDIDHGGVGIDVPPQFKDFVGLPRPKQKLGLTGNTP
jgi:hypothetical protein